MCMSSVYPSYSRTGNQIDDSCSPYFGKVLSVSSVWRAVTNILCNNKRPICYIYRAGWFLWWESAYTYDFVLWGKRERMSMVPRENSRRSALWTESVPETRSERKPSHCNVPSECFNHFATCCNYLLAYCKVVSIIQCCSLHFVCLIKYI